MDPRRTAAALVTLLAVAPCLATPPAAAPRTPSTLIVVTIEPPPGQDAALGRGLRSMVRTDGPLVIQAEPDQDPRGQLLRLRFVDSEPAALRVEARFLTSLVLTDAAGEGKHRDLTDWLHGETAWAPLARAADGSFPLPPAPADQPPFPDYAAMAPPAEWRDVLTDPSWRHGVAWTHLELRLSSGATPVRTITILLPTGC